MSQTTKPAPRGRRTVARHGELHSPHPMALLMKVLGIIVAVVLVSGAGVAAYATYDTVASFSDDAVDLEGQEAVPPDIGAIEGGVNLFIAGTDECEPEYAAYFGDRCTGEDSEGQLNDVNMLVHISDSPRRVTVISFPRDLMIPIPSCTDDQGNESGAMSKQPINTAWSYGGLGCVVKTVSDLSGMSIPFAAKVSFGNVINITDAVGGVDVCLASGIQDYYTGIDWPAGMRNVQGIEALQFLRTRHGVGDGSDLGRISNQQQYMSRMARKLVSDQVLSDVPTLLKLATTAVDNVTPSKSLTNPLTLVQIALAVKNVPFDEIVFVQYPVLTDPDDPNKVVPNDESADALWAALAANQPLQLTGDISANEGVVADPNAVPTDPTTPAPTDPAAPAEQAIALPSDITGSTAATPTCSNGNQRDY
ncbi:LCP family protein [Microbacterium pygmaeum]|uniref:Cell envelope-related function transcriptional attenuator common domain-containing protein n=1 Tax=Microbacterium pygmaeum TaxID=370764 RepID=A0A1G7W787_9MICO|nr:LCP family protein [Microbacterium pygmaeum]SDG67834.1 cell envelope-related function transcriptional attenuator common domain-containing protein [Microbacterium pygmaeum]